MTKDNVIELQETKDNATIIQLGYHALMACDLYKNKVHEVGLLAKETGLEVSDMMLKSTMAFLAMTKLTQRMQEALGDETPEQFFKRVYVARMLKAVGNDKQTNDAG